MADLSSSEKKRLRDRRAQQNSRDKKLRYQANLEGKVAHCERYHNEKGVKELLEIIASLRKENEAHSAREKALKHLIASWDKDPQETGVSNSWPYQYGTSEEPQSSPSEPIPTESAPLYCGKATTSPPSASSTLPTRPSHLSSIEPAWNKRPLYSDDFSDPKTLHCPWFAYPAQVALCPDTPSSPLDILYGDHANMLANMIHLRLQMRPIRDPERLAMGWVIYHFSRWITAPSPENYERIPPFLRPIEDQMNTPHPIVLSWIPWPKVRLNIIRQWHLHDMDREVLFGLLSCCVKIRWPWGVKILERNDKNELCIKPAFYETFMKEEGWGITPEFISRFPNSMTDVDVSSIIYMMS